MKLKILSTACSPWVHTEQYSAPTQPFETRKHNFYALFGLLRASAATAKGAIIPRRKPGDLLCRSSSPFLSREKGPVVTRAYAAYLLYIGERDVYTFHFSLHLSTLFLRFFIFTALQYNFHASHIGIYIQPKIPTPHLTPVVPYSCSFALSLSLYTTPLATRACVYIPDVHRKAETLACVSVYTADFSWGSFSVSLFLQAPKLTCSGYEGGEREGKILRSDGKLTFVVVVVGWAIFRLRSFFSYILAAQALFPEYTKENPSRRAN